MPGGGTVVGQGEGAQITQAVQVPQAAQPPTGFHLDQIAWLTFADSERLRKLNIDPDKDMPNGFYIHNPQRDYTYCEVTEQTQYFIINWEVGAVHRQVNKEEFIQHLEQYKDFTPPFRVVTKGGFVQNITEQYVP